MKTSRQALTALLLMFLGLQPQSFIPAAFAKSATAQQWSVQVDRVDPAGVNLEPSFSSAIYENLLQELAKTRQFKQVFRSGDRNANDVADLLVLKTIVQTYTPGSETRRAVTTFGGATKLNVSIQLIKRDGHVVLEQAVGGNARFIGDNLRATHNLAHNVAKTLKKSALPGPAAPEPGQKTGKDSTFAL